MIVVQILEFEKSDDTTCLICGNKYVVQKMKIMRTKCSENLISFSVCEKCLKIMETNLSGYLSEINIEHEKREFDNYTIYFTYPKGFMQSVWNQSLLNKIPYYVDYAKKIKADINEVNEKDNFNEESYCKEMFRLTELRKDLRRLFIPYSISLIELRDSKYEVKINK